MRTPSTVLLMLLAVLVPACDTQRRTAADAAVDTTVDRSLGDSVGPSDFDSDSSPDSVPPDAGSARGATYLNTLGGVDPAFHVNGPLFTGYSTNPPGLQVYQPVESKNGKASPGYQGLYLSTTIGRLLAYGDDAAPGVCGFVVVRPTGEVVDLGNRSFTCPASASFCDCGTWVATTNDPNVVVTTENVDGHGNILLLRTDGTKWSAIIPSSTYCSVSSAVDSVIPSTLIVSNQHIYALGKNDEPSGGLHLMRSATDCSESTSSPIALPIKGGIVDKDLILSESGDRLFFRAKMTTGDEALMFVDDSAPVARAAATLSPAGDAPLSSYVAVSPQGTKFAYRNGSSIAVHTVESSSPPATVIPGTDFAIGVKPLGSKQALQWINEDTLFFAAGLADSGDLYTYTTSTKKVKRLTTSGSSAIPYRGDGTVTVEHRWPSPGRAFLYFIKAEKTAGGSMQRDLWVVDRVSGKVTALTKGMNVNIERERERFSEGSLAADSDRLFFVASASGVANVYSLDMDNPLAPRKLTANTQTGVGYSKPSPSDNGLHLSYFRVQGGQYELHVATLESEAVRRRKLAELVSPPVDGTNPPVFSPDGSIVVYCGLEYGNYSVRWHRTDGVTPHVVLETAGRSWPVMVF